MWRALSFHLQAWGSCIYSLCLGGRPLSVVPALLRWGWWIGVSLPTCWCVQPWPDIFSSHTLELEWHYCTDCFLHSPKKSIYHHLSQTSLNLNRRDPSLCGCSVPLLSWSMCNFTLTSVLSAFLGLRTHFYIPKSGLMSLVSLDQ